MKIGLALSGGGARCISHLGVLQLFEEIGLKIESISGSSAGAIAGAFFAAGYAPQEIMELIISTKVYKLLRPALSKTGLLILKKTERVFLKYFPDDDFSQLSIPLFVAATDLNRGTTTFFSRGPLIKPLLASACVPVIFEPVKIKDASYIDGGILNNLPIEPLQERGHRIIGLNSNPIGSDFQVTNVKDLVERSLLLAITNHTHTKASACDLFLEPPQLGKYKIFDFGKAREIFDIGYNYAKENLGKLEELIINDITT